MIGCNVNLVEFGPLGQAYGMALFTSVCAFRLAITAVDRRGWWRAFACAVFAGVAAASTLLAACIAPALLIWICLHNRAGNRWVKAAAFAVGAAIPFVPVLWLALQSPWAVWFNVARYQLEFRTVYWPYPFTHDLETLTAWLADPQSLLVGLLAIGGVVYIARQSHWEQARRAEFYLCGWLALGITVELALARPTFGRYFCLAAPFVGLLAVPGLYAVGSRVFSPAKPLWPVLIVSIIWAAVLARELCEHTADSYCWKDYETIAQKLSKVTPPGKEAFTEEEIYFLMKRRPPPGMEFGYSHKLKLPARILFNLHIMPEGAQKQALTSGAFASAATCDSTIVSDYGLARTFRQREDTHGCSVYWDWQRTDVAPVDSKAAAGE